jgi:hypothetical protein
VTLGYSAVRRLRQDLLGGGDGRIDGGSVHVGERLGFGLGNLGFGHLRAACDGLLNLALGLNGETLGLGPCAHDHRLCLLLGVVALFLISRQYILCLGPQATGLVELLPNAIAARIECGQR